MQYYQFGPSLSPFKEQINRIIQGSEGAVGGSVQVNPGEVKGKSASDSMVNPKRDSKWEFPNPPRDLPRINLENRSQDWSKDNTDDKDIIQVPRTEWEEMKRMLAELTRDRTILRETDREDKHQNPVNPGLNIRGKITCRPTNYADELMDSDSEEEEPRTMYHSRLSGRIGRNRYDHDSYYESVYSYDSGSIGRGGNGRRFRGGRHAQERGHGRVEKWKLRFSGDSRGMSVENFLYKASKLAEREGVSNHLLLRDIHMLLEGAASDWFFTYVDDFVTWEDFRNSITYRFGNPNKDQGIRSKIQERKQQRGESFIAFVSEIEKLNRMLSKPLSQRRKFEVIWDNMRQHYRSKISIVRVRDLQHLIDLNYRIDAADHQLQQSTTEPFGRRQVNQVEAEADESETEDQETAINHIGGQQRKSRPPANRPINEPVHQEQPIGQRGNVETGAPRLNCWNCQETGHGWRQCTRPRNVFCYGCGNLGRTIISCERCTTSVAPHGKRAGNSDRGANQGN